MKNVAVNLKVRTIFFGMLLVAILYGINITNRDMINRVVFQHHILEIEQNSHRTWIFENRKNISPDGDCRCYEYKDTVAIPNSIDWIDSARKTNDPDKKLEIMTKAIRSRLDFLGKQSNCFNGLTFECGYYENCGLGCQISHRVTCSLLAYSLGFPLIHVPGDGWQYNSSWTDLYQPLGSGCEIDNNTIHYEWNSNGFSFSNACHNNTETQYPCESSRQIPFREGVPIDKEMLDILRPIHQNPFLWYVGQFVNYATRVSDNVKTTLDKIRHKLDLVGINPVVGIHVRRTDKILEAPYVDISEYMAIAEQYFNNHSKTAPWLVYFASDDYNLLAEIKKQYTLPQWRIIGYQNGSTLSNQEERQSHEAVLSIVIDMYFLDKSEFTVCTLSSNVCRKLYELKAAKYKDVQDRLYSVHGDYSHLLRYGTIPQVLIPV